jgi:hypothetical protein
MVQSRDIGITSVFAGNRDAEIGPVWLAAAGLFERVVRGNEAESSAFYTEGRRLDTGHRLRRQLHIDGFAVGLIGDFEVPRAAWSGLTHRRTGLCRASSSASLRSLAEVCQLIETSFEFVEALCVAFQLGTRFRVPDRSSGICHYSCCK